jgi:hypothetical protein
MPDNIDRGATFGDCWTMCGTISASSFSTETVCSVISCIVRCARKQVEDQRIPSCCAVDHPFRMIAAAAGSRIEPLGRPN